MDTSNERIAHQVSAFTDANRRSLDVLAAAIHRATGDEEPVCSARAWLLFKWARAQQEPRAAAAAMVRRMSEQSTAGRRVVTVATAAAR